MINKKWGLFICILIGLLFLSIVYKSAFFSPNKYLFTAYGDGLKNYYNYVWHIKNDTSLTQFSGMSYPYGEALLMEDSLPFISTLIKSVTYVFPSLNDYSIGILNLFLLLSFVIGAIFIYLIFIHFSVPPLFSAISSNAVCILSSQFILLNPAGHWGLSFICFFPIGWYLLIRYFQNGNKIKWSILIGLNILVWTYTHVYLGFIILLFTLAVHFIKGIIEFRTYFKNTKNYLSIAIQIILPVLVIFSFLHFTDHHPDRIDMPYIANLNATFYCVFVPVISPLKSLYNLFFDLTVQENFSWCRIGNYIGLTSNIAICSFVFLSIYYFVIRKSKYILNYLPYNMLIYILASVIILIYSMAIPLKYFPTSIINAIPLIKQFSSLGRFAWAFYYVIMVFSIVFFYKLLYNKIWSRILLYCLVLLYVFEGITSHLNVSNNIIKHPNTFNKNYLPEDQKVLANIDKNQFQAIIPIPYYFKFNLPFSCSVSDSSIYSSMIAAYYSKLPILSTYLSRPSVSESLKIFKQLMPYPFQEMIPQVVKNRKDFAVILDNSDLNLLNENEKQIIKKCTVYLSSAKYTIYRLSIDSLLKTEKEYNKVQYNLIKKNLFLYNNTLVSDTSDFFIYYNFDSLSSTITYNGSGSFYGIKKNFNVICKTSTERMDTAKEYIISFWYYNYIWDQTFTTAVISESDSFGRDLQYLYYSPIETNAIDGWWYLSEYSFKIKSKKSILTISFQGDQYFEKWFLIDNLLIRPKDLNIYNSVIKNGLETIYLNNKKLIVL